MAVDCALRREGESDTISRLENLLAISETVAAEPIFWSGDGSAVMYIGSSAGGTALLAVPAARGKPALVCDRLGGMPFLGTHEPRISPDGRSVAFLSNAADATGEGLEVEIWLEALEGETPPRQLTHFGASINAFQWSPDASRIVLSSSSRGRYNVYTVEVATGRVTQRTDSLNYEVYPIFAGDSRILFVRLDSTWTKHEVLALDGGGTQTTLVRDNGFFDYHYGRTFGYPLPRPGGADFLFRSHRSGWINYWAASTVDPTVDPVALMPAEADQSDARWSPDGSRLAYIENHNGTAELRLFERASGRILVLDGGPDCACALPAWSPDGNRIAYLRQSTVSPLGVWTVDTRSAEKICLTPPDRDVDLVAPKKVAYSTFDGRQIHGYLYEPPGSVNGRSPGLMWIHGGPTSQFGDTYQPWVQFFANSGYTLLLPNIRGSSGYGKEFEDLNDRDWGHDDLKDVLAGVDYMGTLGTVDIDRVGIHGTSYGGCMSMSAICWAPGVFRAAIPHAGYADWEAMFSEQELRHLQLLRYELGPFPESADVYRYCSPIHDVASIQTPTLVVHGSGRLAKSDASRQFVEEMRRFYKAVRYRVYEDECYYVRSRDGVTQMLADMLAFLDQHLMPDREIGLS
jgi:dipeptidyl aminopeptidase/acylaminoacyl peptidase